MGGIKVFMPPGTEQTNQISYRGKHWTSRFGNSSLPNNLPLLIKDRHSPRPNLNSLLNSLLILARLQPPNQLLRVKVRPDRILDKGWATYKSIDLVYVVEILTLRLDVVSVRVMVVDAGRRAI